MGGQASQSTIKMEKGYYAAQQAEADEAIEGRNPQ